MKLETTKRTIMLLALVLIVSIVGAACGSKAANTTNTGEGSGTSAAAGSANDQAEELAELTLGLLPSIDAIPFIIAHEQGFDQKHGVLLDIETFKSAKDRDVAFQAGKVDGISADLVAISIYNEAGLDVKITSTTFGEFDLLTGNSEIQDVKDLKGKTVILSKNTSTQYTVAMMLKQAGLTEQDIRITEVPQIPTRLELLKNNKADAAILPEPFVTMGQAAGLRILSSTHQANINPFVLAFPQSAIDAKAEAIRAMYAAYDEAVAYMQSHDKADYIDLVIEEVGYPETLKEQIEVPAYIPANQVDVKEVEAAFAWAREQGLLTKDIAPEEVISDVQFKK
ncbi:aliphatic sulfonate ABC transporter substrate-binding protein [Paenibacillus antibioticophila]|uniref:Aliphatic sulfonate ABC transporter substrate-binding protein n=1 Tax=Paenibacillus antibioticophila TaxID=1274374 RepID=A0A919XTB7_9BACL|nr:ABC transporter substrate-binding protein [Paenibacillus antibioticophila]GIO36540.1 aliphatic sulfonate ABC transporter substrate-binding protein [Paenibacillus antibioticophila]